MLKPILVTGLPRSGTSLVTQVLHEDLRIQMAETIAMSRPGSSFLDYEDLSINIKLAEIWFGNKCPDDVPKILNNYLRHRNLACRHSARWGFKSIYMLFYMRFARPDYIVIKTKRDVLASKKSLHHSSLRSNEFNALSMILDDGLEIYNDVRADIIVDVDALEFDRDRIAEFLRKSIKEIDVKS